MSLNRCWMALGFWSLLVAVSAAAPIKTLIVDGQNNHNWKEATPILKKLLEQSGLFAVEVATTPAAGKDMSSFRPDFTAYQLVVMNYTGDDWPKETLAGLAKFIADGGGMVIYHAADNAFPDSKEYNEMIGLGGWSKRDEKHGPYVYYKDGKVVRDNSPGVGGSHGSQHVFPIVVRDKEHPITKGLPEKFLHGPDELYDRLRGPAKNFTILATVFSDKATHGSGREEPVLMTVDYGKGHVFHTTLGHAGKQLAMPSFIVTFLRGAEWAATGKVTQEVPGDLKKAE